MFKNKLLWSFALFLVVVSFIYRIKGIKINSPFWVDEFSTAIQSKTLLNNGLKVFEDRSLNFERQNITTYSLVAVAFKTLGKYEWSARLPFIIIGSLIPAVLFILSYNVFGFPTAVSASLFSAFSYYFITWSRQARGYVLIQLLSILAFYLYSRIRIREKPQPIIMFCFLMVLLLGILTHFMFYIVIATIIIHFAVFNHKKLSQNIKNVWLWIFGIVIIGAIIIFGQLPFFTTVIVGYIAKVGTVNNLWFYHSFLWRQYGLVTFLATIGILIALAKKNREITLLVSFYILSHLFALCFLLSPYTSRYLLPVFSFLYIYAAYAVTEISGLFFDEIKSKPSLIRSAIPIFIIITIIINGDKFTVKPKKFYSVNHDFREIALVDYSSIYSLIKNRNMKDKTNYPVIDTWLDRVRWYLGDSYKPRAYLHWGKEEGTLNGLPKTTSYFTNKNGEKILTETKNEILISDLNDLNRITEKYPKGYIFIDDETMPKDIVTKVKKNFKKEIYLDHYYLDDNPYSLWPATLYSWGFK